MNIARIEAHDFRSWHELDFTVPAGLTLISGVNGAGKSSVLDAVEFALYGATSDAGRLIRRGTDKATVEVRVETEQGLLFVERTVRRDGRGAKVSLDVLVDLGPGDVPEKLTAATATETQKLLVEMLGVDRETFRASAYSAQNDGASFCEAKPSDRKRILGDVLGLGLWDGLHARARAELGDAKRVADVAHAELERLDGASDRDHEARARYASALQLLEMARDEQEAAEGKVEQLAAEAEAAREARRQHAAAVEQQQRAQADHARATAERAAADEALERAKTAAANAPSVDEAGGALSDAMDELGEASERHEFAIAAARTHAEQLGEAHREAIAATERRDRAAQDLSRISTRLEQAQSNTCPECHQKLVTPEARAITERMAREEADALATMNTEGEKLSTWNMRRAHLETVVMPAGESIDSQRQAAQDAQKRLADAEAIALLADTIDAFQQRGRGRGASDREHETATALRETTAILAESTEHGPMDSDLEGRHSAAVTALAEARSAHSTAAADLARAEEGAKVAEQQAADEAAARERLEVATKDVAVLEQLVAGFSPSGVPAMVIDNVLGDLADEANRVLGELGTAIRVDLRSQKVLKTSDRLADTLDIVVTIDAMEAAYETLSGGERTRVAMALRAALTRLLASKSGARVKLLVCDEPSGLDGPGSEAFASVLEEFVRAGIFESVILVTHSEALADQIQNVVRIAKTPGGESYLVGAAVEAERVTS